MKVKFITPRAQLYVFTAAAIAGLTMPGAHAIAPPPPSGPPAPLLTSIEISGPAQIVEGSSGQYVCTATYSDSTSKDVVAAWSEDSAVASINTAGVLTAGMVGADQNITITAAFGGYTATYDLTISDVPVVLTGLEISGPASVDEETSAQYNCTASYSDGSTLTVTPVWGENAASAEISASGLLAAGDVASDQTATLTASFGGLTDSHVVLLRYIPPVLTGLMIIGPAVVDEGASASYLCMASYSDGSVVAVTPAWGLSSGIASISATGMLSAGDVTADQTVTLSASFGGVSDSHALSINYIAPSLTGISISGPSVLDEESAAQYFCTATYSDGTSAAIDPVWTLDSSFATIGSAGELIAGDVTGDVDLTLSASFEDKASELSLTVRVADLQIIYPLVDFAGKTVRADLWDSVNELLMPLGELTSPDELIIENLKPGQWYWLTIQELSTASGDWVPVQENWINM